MSSPLPISKRQFELLGRRLVASESPAADDLEVLHEALAIYGDRMALVSHRVSHRLGLEATSRLKNTGTILEKLERNGGKGLSSIYDLAGLRIVGPIGRHQQDVTVDALVSEFAHEERPAKVIDRREVPSYGYRAVHVVVYPDGIPVEVQVRTEWQHQWAEVVEKLADQLGRGIRYGQPPIPWSVSIDWAKASRGVLGDVPDARDIYDAVEASRHRAVELTAERSERIDETERRIEEWRQLEPGIAIGASIEMDESVREIFQSLQDLFDGERRLEKLFERIAEVYPLSNE